MLSNHVSRKREDTTNLKLSLDDRNVKRPPLAGSSQFQKPLSSLSLVHASSLKVNSRIVFEQQPQSMPQTHTTRRSTEDIKLKQQLSKAYLSLQTIDSSSSCQNKSVLNSVSESPEIVELVMLHDRTGQIIRVYPIKNKILKYLLILPPQKQRLNVPGFYFPHSCTLTSFP